MISDHKSGEIASILGYRGREELIHRDDLALSQAEVRVEYELTDAGRR